MVGTAEVLQSGDLLLARARRLIACANATGGEDNITVLLAEVAKHSV
jgi:serine/threonine protein phosphatase PrpC